MMSSVRALRSDRRPLYVRAVDALYDYIEMGGYSPGQPLPSEDELARQLGVSRSTIREALGHLERDGAVSRRQGVGTFLSPRSSRIAGGIERLQPFRHVAAMAGARADVVQRRVDSVRATDEVASALDIGEGSSLLRLRVVEAVDGCNVAYLEGFIPVSIADRQTLVQSDGSLLEYLIEQSQPVVAYARSEIATAEADDQVAHCLSVVHGMPLLRLIEIIFSDSDEPIAFFRNYFVTECYSLKVVRRIVRREESGRARYGAD